MARLLSAASLAATKIYESSRLSTFMNQTFGVSAKRVILMSDRSRARLVLDLKLTMVRRNAVFGNNAGDTHAGYVYYYVHSVG